MRVLVTTPYGVDSLQGNTVTAKRISSLLREAGLDAVMVSDGKMGNGDVMIALHARKSAHFIDEFLKQNPAGKVILYLTGTDLYYDVPNGCAISEKSMSRADVLVVSQEASLASVPEKYQTKAEVIYTSIELPDEELSSSEDGDTVPTFISVGHLRAVKQPLMGVKALQLLDKNVRLVLLGSIVDEELGSLAREWEERDARFRWIDGVSHTEALRWMKRSLVTLNTSVMEGGANAVGESIVLGVPVLASKIEGNIGMLGADYVGYFSPDSEQELADLMQRVLDDRDYLKTLREQVRQRAERFTRESEKQGWLRLIQRV